MAILEKRGVLSMYKRLLILLITIIPSLLSAQYFDSEIRYFKKDKIKSNRSKENKKSSKPPNNEEFDWATQLNPESDEFFKEGDYTPPKAFMEAVRRPNDGNISNYKKYIKKRSKLYQRFVEKLNEGGLKPEKNLSQVFSNAVNTDVKVLFFFREDCPYCKKMYKEINNLSLMGYQIEAFRVSDQSEVNQPIDLKINFKTVTGEVASKIGVLSVPYLKVISSKKTINLKGYKDLNSIISFINKNFKRSKEV